MGQEYDRSILHVVLLVEQECSYRVLSSVGGQTNIEFCGILPNQTVDACLSATMLPYHVETASDLPHSAILHAWITKLLLY